LVWAWPAGQSVVVALNDRVSDRSLGNYSDNILHPRAIYAVKDDRGARATTLEPGENQAEQIVITTNNNAAFDKAFNEQVRIGLGLKP
jgi:hypothetical protein